MHISRRAFFALCSAGAALPHAAKAAGKRVVGISMPGWPPAQSAEDASIMVDGLRATDLAADVKFAATGGPTQTVQVDTMIVQGVDALLISPVAGAALSEPLVNANALRIPVVAFDRMIHDTPYVDFYTAFDNYHTGELQARSLLEGLKARFPGQKPWRVELFAGAMGDSEAQMYFAGAMSVLKPAIAAGQVAVPSGQVDIDSCATLAWDSAVAHVRMDNLVAATQAGTRIDGILSPDDAVSAGILSSLAGAGYGIGALKMPIVTGQGCGVDAVKAIIAGKLYSSVFKDRRRLARAAVKLVDEVLVGTTPGSIASANCHNGRKVVPAHLVKPVTVNAANWQRVLVKSGYYRLSQLR